MIDKTQTNYHGKKSALEHFKKTFDLYGELPLVKRDILVKWKKKFNQLVMEEDDIPYPYLYPMTVGLPTGVFSYQFDPTELYFFIQDESIHPISLETDMMIKHIDKKYWASHPDDTPYPPVILETPLLPKGFLVIGQKMIMQQKMDGGKKVKVYSLSEMEFISLMYDPLSKLMYCFHRDLQNLLSSPVFPSPSTLFLHQIDVILASHKAK